MNTYIGYFSFKIGENVSGRFELIAKATSIFEVQRVYKKKLQQFSRTSNHLPKGSEIYLLDVIELTTDDTTFLSIERLDKTTHQTVQISLPERIGNSTAWSFSEPDDPQVFFKP